MLINLSELFSCQGKMKTYTPDLEMIQCPTPDGVCEIVEKGPISLTIVNEGDRKMHMEGSVRLSLSMPCSRCLEPVTVPFELEIDQELDLSQTEEERVEALDEQPYIRRCKPCLSAQRINLLKLEEIAVEQTGR